MRFCFIATFFMSLVISDFSKYESNTVSENEISIGQSNIEAPGHVAKIIRCYSANGDVVSYGNDCPAGNTRCVPNSCPPAS